ncbi:hypothetical protein CLOLEP_00665 [[Clostridium] leptum DSM 753]|uniref:Uncharacterized protein n=1 Tax=[Clostridium] leptum DSM 753 TaxID=428125 RepID=A7VQ38_9FIRM|nr:hypothetical protein CLOLEP_00665 [[Clostridium] leptum DSM 753]
MAFYQSFPLCVSALRGCKAIKKGRTSSLEVLPTDSQNRKKILSASIGFTVNK